jgi:phosphonate transport system permease protein
VARRIFISYRRGDEPAAAVRICDGLSARFGRRHVFIDVERLLPGGRFEDGLGNALDYTDVFIAVIGPRWKELLASRNTSEERDYVREEIAGALQRKISIIPVRVGHQGALPLFPNADELPPDIRDFVRYQTQDITYESFGRDIGLLTEAIDRLRKDVRGRRLAAGSLIPQRIVVLILAVIVCGLLTVSSSSAGLAATGGAGWKWGGLSWFLYQMASPNFSNWPDILKEVGITLAVALWGLMLAGVISLPLSILCSANLTPALIAWPVRRMAGIFEATNVAMTGVVCMVLFGLGPLTAVVAICLHNIGILTKSFSEAIETADRPIEGIRRASASWSQIMYAVFPEVRPRWIASLCTSFNNSLTGAIVIGMLIGYGIGGELLKSVQLFDLRQMSAILIITIAAIAAMEMATRQIRNLVGQP